MYIVPTAPFEFGCVWQGRFGVADTLLGRWDPHTENANQRALVRSIIVNSVPQAQEARWGLHGHYKRFVE